MTHGLEPQRDFTAGVAGNRGQDARKRKADTGRKSPDLILLKTQEFLERIEASVDKENELYTKIRKYKSQPDLEKLKACNFPARKIQIGYWERMASNDNDIVVKFYFNKKQMVWEVLVGQMKKKIEISWNDLSALRATFAKGEPSTLYIELNKPPNFFDELDAQPRKHTAWTTTQDFTSGEALKCRRHTLKFSEGILERHYEKIVHSNGWLFHKHHRPFPAHNSPLFDVVQRNDTPLNHQQCAYNLIYERAIPAQQHALMVHPLRQLPPELPHQAPPFPRSFPQSIVSPRQLPPELPHQAPPFPRSFPQSIVSPNLHNSSVIGNMDLSSHAIHYANRNMIMDSMPLDSVNNRGQEVERVHSTPAPNVYLRIDPQTQYCAQAQALHANAIPAGSSLNGEFHPSPLMPTGAYNHNEAYVNPTDEGISLRNPTDEGIRLRNPTDFSHANGLPEDFFLANNDDHNLYIGDNSVRGADGPRNQH